MPRDNSSADNTSSRPFLNTYPEDAVLPITSLLDPDSDEAAQVELLFKSHSNLISGTPPTESSLRNYLLPPATSTERTLRRGDLEDDDEVIIYTRKEIVIKQQQQSSRKRSFDQVEEEPVEGQEEGRVVAPGSEDQIEEELVETTVRTEIRVSRSPPRKKRLSAIDEKSDRDQLPMDGVSFLLSSSTPSSPTTFPVRSAVVPSTTVPQEVPTPIEEEPYLPMDDDEPAASSPPFESQPQPLESQPTLEPSHAGPRLEPPLEPEPAQEEDDLFGDEPRLPQVGASNRSALAHFLSSRGKTFETRREPPPLEPQPSLPRQLRTEKEVAAPVVVEDKAALPTNLAEFELAWVAGGVEPGAHGKESPPVLHVVSGQRLLQNRSGESSSPPSDFIRRVLSVEANLLTHFLLVAFRASFQIPSKLPRPRPPSSPRLSLFLGQHFRYRRPHRPSCWSHHHSSSNDWSQRQEPPRIPPISQTQARPTVPRPRHSRSRRYRSLDGSCEDGGREVEKRDRHA